MSRPVLALSFVLVAVVAGSLGVLAGGGVPVPGRMPPSFADIVERINPSVVHISVVERGDGTPSAKPDEKGPRMGEGSGIIVDPQGLVLTNEHVVASSSRIRVRLADQRELKGTLVGSDADTDLALVKIDATGLAAATLGDSDHLRVGEWVCAIGNPYGYDHSVTVGVVSSKGRKIYDASFDAYIQTDAAINPGSSGGPLIDVTGKVVGINSAVSSEGQGIGFAVPINLARGVLDQLRSTGHVTRGYLGIQLHDPDPALLRLVGVQAGQGAVVTDVAPDSAGEHAGLRRYDVITALSGKAVQDGDQLVREVAARAPGTAVVLSVLRDGHALALPAQLGNRDAETERPQAPTTKRVASGGDALGLRVADLGRRQRRELAIPEGRRGVLVNEVRGDTEDLDEGDVVMEINRHPTPDRGAYEAALRSLTPGNVAWVLVYRPEPPGSFLVKVEVEQP